LRARTADRAAQQKHCTHKDSIHHGPGSNGCSARRRATPQRAPLQTSRSPRKGRHARCSAHEGIPEPGRAASVAAAVSTVDDLALSARQSS
jgi:hypothetical protein